MKIWVFTLLISFIISNSLIAKTLEQKKTELKKSFEAGVITKVEFKKAQEYLENLDKEKEKKEKKTLSLTKKKTKINLLENFKKKKDDEEEITLKKIEELGPIVKFDDKIYPDAMFKKLSKGCQGFKCKGDKAGKVLYKSFNRSKAYSQRNPGEMIQAMAMFEVFYSSKLYYNKKAIERYKNNDYTGAKKFLFKEKDEKEIRSLFGINKGRKAMREALGMTMETPSKEAIKKFWLLGEFLNLGTGVKNKKLAQDLKQRQEKLANYKSQVAKLRKKLQEDLEGEEDEKPTE